MTDMIRPRRLLLTLATYLLFASTALAQVPAPWTAQDVGVPTVAGTTSVTAGVFTVNGQWVDIWNAADQMYFLSQPLTGDGEIVARVDSISSADVWAKAGVMIREDLTPGSPNAMAYVRGGGNLIASQRLARNGLTTSTSGTVVPGSAPYWIRLVRVGNVFSASSSPTGTAWTPLGSVTIPMAASAQVGLAVSSNAAVTAPTAVFSQVSVTPAAPPPPPTRIVVTATSVMGWDQVAPDAATAQSYTFNAYVDGVKGPALSDTCTGTAIVCTAPIPAAALVTGDHAIEVTATSGGIETAKTNTVLVTAAAPALIVTSTAIVMTGTPTTATFTATVTSPTGVPSGAIVFKDNGIVRRTTTLSATGTAVWGPLTTLALGSHVITAEYAGSATMSASVSPGLSTTVTITAPTGLRVTP